MRAINLGKAAMLAAAVALASGCSSTSTTSDVSAVESDQQPADTSASSFGAGSGTGVSGSALGGAGSVSATQGADLASLQTVFYFDFDKAQIRSEAFNDLNAHAAYLSRNPTAKVVLEGHADERGTREYNMALGERRAKAVSRYMNLQGASAAQIEVVSFGEEKPAVLGHDDSAWSQNRRVEVKYESY